MTSFQSETCKIKFSHLLEKLYQNPWAQQCGKDNPEKGSKKMCIMIYIIAHAPA